MDIYSHRDHILNDFFSVFSFFFWPQQILMTYYNFMLYYVCLLQLKQEHKLIFDEKYALLGFHFSTTNLV